jgi:hypothetical protein
MRRSGPSSRRVVIVAVCDDPKALIRTSGVSRCWLGLVVVGAVASFLAAGCDSSHHYSAGPSAGKLHVEQLRVTGAGFFVEGSYSYIRIERSNGDKLIEQRLSNERTPQATVRLDPGTYRLVSFQRSCSGNCNYLDPPGDFCSHRLTMDSATRVAAVIHLSPGAGCEITTTSQSTRNQIVKPFVAGVGLEAGPGSGLWGDLSSGPDGMQIGCIRGRRFAILIGVRNRTRHTVRLLGSSAPRLLGAAGQGLSRVIESVAAQVTLAPPPPKGDVFVSGLRAWSSHDSSSVAIPARREGWVQLSFLMRNCNLLRKLESTTVNRRITLGYSVGAVKGTQVLSPPGAQIILTRGPSHPRLPINQVG